MSIYRHIGLFQKLAFQNYGKVTKNMSTRNKMVHQEMMRYVNPFARINIKSEIFVRIRPSDVHNYPNGDAFIAELHGDTHSNNCTATMAIKVSDDEKEVDIELKKLDPRSQFHCEMSLPIKAEIKVESNNNVNISHTQSECINICTDRDIHARELRAENIKLISKDGKIQVNGLLLGKNSYLETISNGDIILDKLQGDDLYCKTNSGKISVQSCYVTKSKFETKTGNMELNNVHRNSKIELTDSGNLKMNGIHGNVGLKMKGGTMDLHFSQLEGLSEINCLKMKSAKINISEDVENYANICLETTDGIAIAESLTSFSRFLSSDAKRLVTLQRQQLALKEINAFINCEAPIYFGKLSWEETLRAKLKLLSRTQ